VGLLRADGVRLWAQVPRDEAERLELDPGQIVYARTRRERVFDEAGPVKEEERELVSA
jgi:hypothetical protein